MVNSKISAQAQPMSEDFEESAPGDLLAQGKTLQKAGTPFVSAITVQKPRDLDRIVKAIDREAEYAGDSFYYGWTDKKGNRIEGPSIGLANSLAREWTNCAVTVDFQESDEVFIITPRFVDIEKGFQCERVFRQRKNVVQGNFDPDRKLDMALQIGQSKAIRNVVVNAVPRWLVERAMEKAKEAVLKGIDPNKLGEYKEHVTTYFKAKGVTAEQLVAKAGKPMAEWTTRDIADFKGDKKALENGEVTISELFPPLAPKAPAGPISASDLPIAGVSRAAAPEPAVQDEPPAPSKKEHALKCATCAFGTDEAQAMEDHVKVVHGVGAARTQKAAAPAKPAATGKAPGSLFTQ